MEKRIHCILQEILVLRFLVNWFLIYKKACTSTENNLPLRSRITSNARKLVYFINLQSCAMEIRILKKIYKKLNYDFSQSRTGSSLCNISSKQTSKIGIVACTWKPAASMLYVLEGVGSKPPSNLSSRVALWAGGMGNLWKAL